MQWSWRQWIWLSAWVMLICVGCGGQLLTAGAAPAVNSDDQTVEVVPLRSIELVPSIPISVEVQNGDISVVALDATRFFSGAIFIEDDIVFTADITETLEITDKAGLVKAEVPDGVKSPRAVTHLRVPEKVALNLHTRKGSIFVSGLLGDITAVAGDGRIEVRGRTGALTLTTNGASGIVVDGETGSLILASGAGPIEITTGTAAPQVHVSTVSGSVFFSGKLADGSNYFTATAAGPITVMMPRDLNFDIIARTANSAISVQYPTTPTKAFVCATMDSGWPVDVHYDSTYGKPRAQITVKPAANQMTTPVIISGSVGLGFFMFHTTMHNFITRVPDLSDLALDQVNYAVNIPGLPTITAAGPTIVQSPQNDAALEQAARDQGFKTDTGQEPTAIPLNGGATASPTSPNSTQVTVWQSGRAIPMKGDNCPLPIPPPAGVRVYLVSAGGQIRILQMSPGR